MINKYLKFFSLIIIVFWFSNVFAASNLQQLLVKNAMRGDTTAMMKLFSQKSFGQTPQDWMESYAWGCLAITSGFPTSQEFNQQILDKSSKQNLTPDQYKHAKEMAAKLIKKVLGNKKQETQKTIVSFREIKKVNVQASS